MRIGAHAQIWVAPVTGDNLDVIEHARNLGFEAIDINVAELPPPFPPAEMRRRLEAAGLQVSLGCMLNAQRDITSDDLAYRQSGIKFLQGMVRLCGEVGAKNLIGPYHSELRRQRFDSAEVRAERWKRCVEGLSAVAREAEQSGIRMGLEILNRYESDFLTTTSDGVRLCREVGSSAMGLLLDTYHMNIEERRIGEAFRCAAGYIAHVHTCENDRGAPGSGHLDWTEIRDALRDARYAGICTIESYNPTLPALAQRCSFWRPLSSNQDDLAREGLAFLRKLLSA